METVFYCAEKCGRQISLVGRSMHRIYNAARKCGYLKNVIKPIDPRDAKKISKDKNFKPYKMSTPDNNREQFLKIDHKLK